jgi:oligopeptidase B
VATAAPEPPAAPRRPHKITLHGETRTDEYFWLREKDAPEVLGHLEAENAYTAAVMAPHAALEEAHRRVRAGETRGRIVLIP